MLVLAGVLGAAGLLYFHRPQGQFFYPRCTFHAATGWLCPGCGGLRATHELLHGRVWVAARSNALLVVGLPVLAAVWGWTRWRTGRMPLISSRWVWVMFAVALVFTVARNLPWPPFSRWLVP